MLIPSDSHAFREAVLLFPIAQALHVLEEWPGFPRWARRFASRDYTDREYVTTHVLALAVALVASMFVRAVPTPSVVFVFFAFVFGPGILCNAFFHAAGTIASRTYCPGLLTGVFLYVPLSALLVVITVHTQVLSVRMVLLALLIAAMFHTIEVGHNVFKRW